jgi:dTDP-4-amino-4,6-dideoxygalactose transaminase
MKIPLFDLDYDNREAKAVLNVLDSKWLSMGESTKAFEAAFAGFLGVKHAIALNNCTAGLHLAYKSVGLTAGDEVICPSLSFVATSNAILYSGAKPVFVDISSKDNWTISPEKIEKAITGKTKAIVVMHYAGFACSMNEIMQIAKKHNLKVIEDCAHSPGSKLNGKHLGTFGDVSAFSFFSNKNLSTGEGGMVCTNNDNIADQVRLYRSHGMTSLSLDRHKGHAFSYDVISPGYNYRIDEIRSALGLVQLKKLENNNQKRREIAKYYFEKLQDISEIKIPFLNHEGLPNYHIFPVLLDEKMDREALMKFLREKGIQSSIHYPSIHKFTYYHNKVKSTLSELNLTECISLNELTLPMYSGMNNKQINYIELQLKEFLLKT